MKEANTKYCYSGPIRLLSVIMPVYNEASSLKAAIEEVLCERRDGTAIELIIVESGSTDGSREIVESYRDRESVRVVFEDSPRGKGHAVRNGFDHARGDAAAIFDADGEYRFSDIWKLLEPIEEGRAAFVLGSRHEPGRKVRSFDQRSWLARAMNLMHWVFATLINLAFEIRVRDPFTMWKVFRIELLQEVDLVSERFDLDWEIVGKFALLRFVPLEIPVAYSSRDYSEGKKVRLFSDPISWLRLLVRLRFGKEGRKLRERSSDGHI